MARINYKEAAGIIAKRGKPAKGRKPDKTELEKFYVVESKSIREVAEHLECSKDMVYRALKEYGIARKPNSKRSKIRHLDISLIKEKIKQLGITNAARELGVDIRTLKKLDLIRELDGKKNTRNM
jgi:transposase